MDNLKCQKRRFSFNEMNPWPLTNAALNDSIFLFQVTISVFNVAIGVSINQIKESLSTKNRFKLVQKIQLSHDIEDAFIFASKIFQRCRFLNDLDPSECVRLLKKSEDTIVEAKLRSQRPRNRDASHAQWTKKLNYAKMKEEDYLVDVYLISPAENEEGVSSPLLMGSIPGKDKMLNVKSQCCPTIRESKQAMI